jgi:hypothetical protein
MMTVSRRWLVGLSLCALLTLPGVSRGHGCCGGNMMVMQQRMRQQLLQQQSLQLQNMVQKMSTQSTGELAQALQDPQDTSRFLAALVIGDRQLPLQDNLIQLLTDRNDLVRQAARSSLIQLSKNVKKKDAKGCCMGKDKAGSATAMKCMNGKGIGKNCMGKGNGAMKCSMMDKGMMGMSKGMGKGMMNMGRQGYPAVARGVDFGPAPGASSAAQNAAAKKWRAWFENHGQK